METLKGFSSLPQVRHHLLRFLDQNDTNVFFILTPMDNGLGEFVFDLFRETGRPVSLVPQMVFTDDCAAGQVMAHFDQDPEGDFLWIDALENLLSRGPMAGILGTLNQPGGQPKLLRYSQGKVSHEIEFSGKLIVFAYAEEYVSKPLPSFPGVFLWWSIEDTLQWTRWKSGDLARELSVAEDLVHKLVDQLELGRELLRMTLRGGIPRIRVLKQAISSYAEHGDFQEVLKTFHTGFDLRETPGIYING